MLNFATYLRYICSFMIILSFFLQKPLFDGKIAGKFCDLSASSIMVCPDVFRANEVAVSTDGDAVAARPRCNSKTERR